MKHVRCIYINDVWFFFLNIIYFMCLVAVEMTSYKGALSISVDKMVDNRYVSAFKLGNSKKT